jgi:stearoyl-CoA desaturase (Delta-9 desaturase)
MSLWSWDGFVAGLAAGVAFCQINLYLTSAVLHRGMTHDAILFPRWLERVTAVWLWLTACTPVLTWIAAHKHHHVHSDTDEDLHSPWRRGVGKVMLLTWYYVTRWARQNWAFAEERYLRRFRDERLLHFLDRRGIAFANFYAQIALSLALGPAAIACWLGRVPLYMVISGYVNAAGHTWGARPFDNLGTDAARWWQRAMGWITGGELLGHNYHHRYPRSATFRPRRFDPGLWFATRVLRGVEARPRPEAPAEG